MSSLAGFQKVADPIRQKDLVLLLVNRQNTFLYVPIEGEQRPRRPAATAVAAGDRSPLGRGR